jgi:hypothetical protein
MLRPRSVVKISTMASTTAIAAAGAIKPGTSSGRTASGNNKNVRALQPLSMSLRKPICSTRRDMGNCKADVSGARPASTPNTSDDAPSSRTNRISGLLMHICQLAELVA